MKDQISAGDHVTAVMGNSAPIGGSTQEWSFQVDSVTEDIVRGEDHMDDGCAITLDDNGAHYSDSGKSKDVVEIRVHESHPDGGYWGNKYETVWSED